MRARHQSNFEPGAVVYGSPSVCPPPDQGGPPPVDFGPGGGGVRLAVDLPAADAPVEFAERLFPRGCTPTWRVVRPLEHRAVLHRVPHLSRLEERDARAGLRERV